MRHRRQRGHPPWWRPRGFPRQINKQATTLTFTVPAAPLGVGDAVVTLLAADGTPLKEKTIVFLVTSGATTTAVAEITDGAGQARISQPVPEAADYTVEAYFGQTAALPGGRSVTLLDPLYGPSSATGSIVLPSGVALVLTNEQTKIVYNDSKAAGASNGNRGHGLTRIDAGISFDDPAFVRTSILSSPTSSTVTARIRALLSGAILFEGNITLAVTGPGSSRWSGQASINGTTAQLTVAWISSAYTGNTGDIDVTITTPKGHGPLYNDLPAILDFDLTLGTGAGETPIAGSLVIGGPDLPWKKENNNLRERKN